MYEILLGLFLIIALALIGIILLQQGKGADLGASFGAGASNTVFGAAGSGNFMTKATWWLSLASLVILLVLGYLASHRDPVAAAGDDVFAAAPASEAPATTLPIADVPALAAPAPASNSDVPAAPADAQPASDTPKP
ncbi:preprotein translocase subunit SecG [Permianibacter sp. IMCC34836]|uniref:preprotein translocase subunit SecG n=1 Tax=Permianibacter fluminis TaxID=2738515 RepID=UPI0015526A28|nr:preprotein translocase subunit SecG [Permianibacter fluminis]NQD36506.1 preprotein translocase subunit SecG [Permianibacter fluminis]